MSSSLSPADAQSALKDIEITGNRSAASHYGERASPHLMLWGVAWIVGYLGLALGVTWIWLAVVPLGVIGSTWLGMRAPEAGKGVLARYILSIVLVVVFITALFYVMRPREMNQISAFYPLVGGVSYALIGIWTKGWKLAPLGVALMVLTLVGYVWLPDHFLYWMAGVGGGGLILGGFWLRSV